jgi:hypothetical protein
VLDEETRTCLAAHRVHERLAPMHTTKPLSNPPLRSSRKPLTLLALALAGAVAPASPASASKGTPDGFIESPEALKALWNTKVRPDYVADSGNDLPPIDTLDPGPHCTGPIDAGKQISMSLYEQELLGLRFAVSAAGEIGLVADATKMGAQASIGPSIEIPGFSIGGQAAFKPLDLRFEAATHANGDSSIEVSIYAFGRMVDSYTIANTSQPIEYIKHLGFSLPPDLTGGWSDTFDCDGDKCAGTYGLDYAAIADLSAILIFRVSTAGVESGALASVNAYAGGRLYGSWTHEDVGTIGTEHYGQLTLARALFGARGRLVPHNGYWLADAAMSFGVDEALGGELVLEFDVPDWIPLLDDVVRFTVLELAPIGFADSWSYQCTFKKPF